MTELASTGSSSVPPQQTQFSGALRVLAYAQVVGGAIAVVVLPIQPGVVALLGSMVGAVLFLGVAQAMDSALYAARACAALTAQLSDLGTRVGRRGEEQAAELQKIARRLDGVKNMLLAGMDKPAAAPEE